MSTDSANAPDTPTPEITFHARERWNDRTPITPMTATVAFRKATSVDHVATAFGAESKPGPDDARLYHGVTPDGVEYAMMFIVHNNAVVTVLPYNGHGDNRVEQYVDKMLDHTTIYE